MGLHQDLVTESNNLFDTFYQTYSWSYIIKGILYFVAGLFVLISIYIIFFKEITRFGKGTKNVSER